MVGLLLGVCTFLGEGEISNRALAIVGDTAYAFLKSSGSLVHITAVNGNAVSGEILGSAPEPPEVVCHETLRVFVPFVGLYSRVGGEWRLAPVDSAERGDYKDGAFLYRRARKGVRVASLNPEGTGWESDEWVKADWWYYDPYHDIGGAGVYGEALWVSAGGRKYYSEHYIQSFPSYESFSFMDYFWEEGVDTLEISLSPEREHFLLRLNNHWVLYPYPESSLWVPPLKAFSLDYPYLLGSTGDSLFLYRFDGSEFREVWGRPSEGEISNVSLLWCLVGQDTLLTYLVEYANREVWLCEERRGGTGHWGLRVTKGALLINLPEGGLVRVYSVDGRLVGKAEGKGTLSVRVRSPGVYILKVGEGKGVKVLVYR